MIQKNPQTKAMKPERPNGIAYLIGRLDHVLNRRIRDNLVPYGVTAAQYTAMAVFRRHGQLSNAQLAERSMVSPQSANEMVKIMEKHGWISRRSAKAHGRIIHISLTPEGEALLGKCDVAVARVEQAMLAELGLSDYGELHTQLRTMVRGLSVMTL